MEIKAVENMTSVDLGIIGFILFLSLKGFFNGFFKELFGLIGIIGGVFVGTRLGHEAGLYINDNFLHLENGSVISVTGFLATLIIFWVGMTIIGNILSAISNKSGLSTVNQLLGFAFAGAKMALILSIIIHSLLSVKVIQESAIKFTENSQVIPKLQELGALVVNADFSTMVSKTEEETGINLDETLENIGTDLQKISNDAVKEIVNQELEKN